MTIASAILTWPNLRVDSSCLSRDLL